MFTFIVAGPSVEEVGERKEININTEHFCKKITVVLCVCLFFTTAQPNHDLFPFASKCISAEAASRGRLYAASAFLLKE